MVFKPGENVGIYRIISLLGQGGMATVYKAYHPGLDRYVAIKVIHPALTEDPSFSARFSREARIAAKLNHPNIVPIYDFNPTPNAPYLVMRYVGGNTLKDLLAAGPLNTTEIMQIARPVAEALAYAHAQGVLHRDIKPSNILIADDGTVYLTDLGLARMAQLGALTLSQDSLVGTPQYVSPEVVKGEPLSERSDIYSFGVVLYEMFVGQPPFRAETPTAVLFSHLSTPVPAPSSLNKNIAPDVEAVLVKALAKEPTDRYENATALFRDLEQATSQLETRAIPPRLNAAETENLRASKITLPAASTSTVPASHFFGLSRQNAFIGGVVLVGLALLFLAAGGLNGSSGAGSAPSPTFAAGGTAPLIALAPTTTPATALTLTTSGTPSAQNSTPTQSVTLTQTPINSPTTGPTASAPARVSTAPPVVGAAPRGKIAFTVEGGDNTAQSYIMVSNADGTNARRVRSFATWPRLSPDGTRLAFYDWRDLGLHMMDLDGRNDHKIVAGESCCLDWSKDGKRIAFNIGRRQVGATIVVADADGTNRQVVATGLTPSWSPDSERLAYVTCNPESTECGVFVVDLVKREFKILTRDGGGNPRWSPDGSRIIYQASAGAGATNIFMINADGTNRRQLTSGKSNDGQPTYSPDGNFLFWRSDQDGTAWAIFGMPLSAGTPDTSRRSIIVGNVPPAPGLWGQESLTSAP